MGHFVTDPTGSLSKTVGRVGFVVSSVEVLFEEDELLSFPFPYFLKQNVECMVGVIPSRGLFQDSGGNVRERGPTVKICMGPDLPLGDGTFLPRSGSS